jgi:hypothetical protein
MTVVSLRNKTSESLSENMVVRTVYSLDVDGPIIQYKTTDTSAKLKIGLKTDGELGKDDYTLFEVENAPLNDVVEIQALKTIEKINGQINLEKHVEYSGAVVDGTLDTNLGKDKIELISSRKKMVKGIFENSVLDIKHMFLYGKWSVNYYKNGSNPILDIDFDVSKSLPEGTVDNKMKTFTRTVHGIDHVLPANNDEKSLIIATRFSKQGTLSTSAKQYGYRFYKAEETLVNSKKTANIKEYSEIVVPGINIMDEFQSVYGNEESIVIVERRSQGEYLNFYKFNFKNEQYSFADTMTRGVGLKLNAVDFTAVSIMDSVVVLYTAIESAKIGFVIYNPVNGDIKQGWFDVDNDGKILPAGIDCLVAKNSNNILQCFVDTIGPLNREIHYTIGSTTKTADFIKEKKVIADAEFNSPRGFERI